MVMNETVGDLISDALVAAEKALSYIEGSLEYDKLKAEYDNVVARRYDKNMRLAIIGDFSCGKSTFLNALFRRDILTRDILPTTSVPTWISWDRNDGEVAVFFRGSDGSIRNLMYGDKNENEAFLGKRLPEGLGPLIEAVTTDNSLRQKVTNVYVSLPTARGREGIYLIDTPGVNPGDEAAKEHINITRAVLKDQADAAIILFPAIAGALNHSFLDFLREYDVQLLRDSIFVITKYDIVESERDRLGLPKLVSGFVEKIADYKPPVYTVSALSALKYCLGEDSADPAVRNWAESFERDMEEIFSSLGARRDMILRHKLTYITVSLTKKLSLEMDKAMEQIKCEQEILAASSPANMEASMKEISHRAISELADAAKLEKSADVSNVANCFDNSLRVIKQKLGTTTSKRDLIKCLNDSVRPEFSALNRRLTTISKTIGSGFHGIFERYKANLVDCCSGYCEKLHISESFRSTDTGITLLPENDTFKIQGLADASWTLSELGMDAGFLLDDIFDFDLTELFSDLWDMFSNLIDNLRELFRPFEDRKMDLTQEVIYKMYAQKKISQENVRKHVDTEEKRCRKLIEELPGQLKVRYAEEFKAAEERFKVSERTLRKRMTEIERAKKRLGLVSARLQRE